MRNVCLAFLSLCVACFVMGCKTPHPSTQGPITEFDITSVQIEVTNPSIAPQYREDTTWSLNVADVPDWSAKIDKVLDETKVNGVVSLRRHIAMTMDGDTEGLEYVDSKTPPPEPQPTGGSQSTVTLFLGGGFEYEVGDRFEYSGEGLGYITEMVYAHGTSSTTKYEEPDGPSEQPEDEIRPTPATVEFDMPTTHARYFETNYSIAPQYRSEDTWVLRADQVENWNEMIDAVLDETLVNGVMTVREHAKLLAEDDEEGLKRLDPPPGVGRATPSGAPTIKFTLNDGEKVVYQFASGLDYTGDKFVEFERLVKKKGSHSSIDPNAPKPTKSPEPID